MPKSKTGAEKHVSISDLRFIYHNLQENPVTLASMAFGVNFHILKDGLNLVVCLRPARGSVTSCVVGIRGPMSRRVGDGDANSRPSSRKRISTSVETISGLDCKAD